MSWQRVHERHQEAGIELDRKSSSELVRATRRRLPIAAQAKAAAGIA
jgi:hypothetical protein